MSPPSHTTWPRHRASRHWFWQLRIRVPRSTGESSASRMRSAADPIRQSTTRTSAKIRNSRTKVTHSMSALTAFLAPGTISAPMTAPVTRPSNRAAGTNNRAREVAESRGAAPGGGARPASGTVGDTGHWRGANLDVAGPQRAPRPAEEGHQPVARVHRISRRAGLVRLARAVHLACRHAGDADPGAFRAPDRPVAIPNGNRGAGEAAPRGHDLQER